MTRYTRELAESYIELTTEYERLREQTSDVVLNRRKSSGGVGVEVQARDQLYEEPLLSGDTPPEERQALAKNIYDLKPESVEALEELSVLECAPVIFLARVRPHCVLLTMKFLDCLS